MGDRGVTLTIPLTERELAVLGLVALVTMVSLVVYWMLPSDRKSWLTGQLARLGAAWVPHWLAIPFVLVWLCLFLVLFVGILWLAIHSASTPLPQTDEEAVAFRWSLLTLAGLIAALGGIVAFPFTLLRQRNDERRTKVDEENHKTELFNKAIENLGAVRVMRVAAKDDAGAPVLDTEGRPTFRDETERNTEVRIGAILSLERLSRANDDMHIQIMETLTAYLRENAKAEDVAPLPQKPEWAGQGGDEYRTEIRNWLEAWLPSKPPTSDIQTGLTVLKRRAPAQWAIERGRAPTFQEAVGSFFSYRPGEQDVKPDAWRQARNEYSRKVEDWRSIPLPHTHDLRQLNGRRADFAEAAFERAQLGGAHLEGAFLNGAHLEGAFLWRAHLEGAVLWGAHLKGADLEEAHLEAADLEEAHLEAADLAEAHLEAADIRGAHLEGADLTGAHLEGADLTGAHLEGAVLWGAHLEGADLTGAHLEGADLTEAHLDSRTSLAAATLRGAAARDVD
ncbi:pentapeptide repeat-containing protein [Pseudoroseicyclus sp. H15]